MNQQVKILIGCVGALILVSGALVLAFMAPEKEDDAVSSSFRLLSGEANSVKVTNEKGTVCVRRNDGGFIVDDLQNVTLSDNPSLLISQAEGLEALREISPADDLGQFGLDVPRETLEIMIDGNAKIVQLGNEAVSSTGRYAMLDGKVYVVTSVLETFAYGKEDFVSLQVTQPLDTGEVIEAVELFNGDTAITLVYVPEEQVEASTTSEVQLQDDMAESTAIPAFYRMTSPITAELTSYEVSNFTGTAFGLSAQAVVSLENDEETLARYGLAEPKTILKVTSSKGKIEELRTSPIMDGSYYVMRGDSAPIYQLGAEGVLWDAVTVETLTKSISATD